jgi:hypothetical protein
MSAVEPGHRQSHDPSAAIAVRVGTVLAVALLLSVAVNVFAGSVAFAVLLAGLAGHTAWSVRGTTRERTRPRAPRDRDEQSEDAPWEPATPPLAPSTPAAGASGSR